MVLPNHRMQRAALRAAAEPDRYGVTGDRRGCSA